MLLSTQLRLDLEVKQEIFVIQEKKQILPHYIQDLCLAFWSYASSILSDYLSIRKNTCVLAPKQKVVDLVFVATNDTIKRKLKHEAQYFVLSEKEPAPPLQLCSSSSKHQMTFDQWQGIGPTSRTFLTLS